MRRREFITLIADAVVAGFGAGTSANAYDWGTRHDNTFCNTSSDHVLVVRVYSG